MTDSNKGRISFSTVTDKQTRRALRKGFKAIGSSRAVIDVLFTYAYVSDQGKAGDTFKQQEKDVKSGGIEGAWENFKSRNTDTSENTIQWPVYFTTCAILYALRQTQRRVECEKKLQHRQSIEPLNIYLSFRSRSARSLFDAFNEITVGSVCSEKWARPLFVKAAQGINPTEVVRANKNMLKDSQPDWHLSEYDMAVLEYFAHYPDSHNKNVINPPMHDANSPIADLYTRYLLMIASEGRHMTGKTDFLKIVHATYQPPEVQFDKATPVSKLSTQIQKAIAG